MSVESTVAEHRLGRLEEAMIEQGKSLKGIEQSLVALTRLEERHRESKEAIARAFQRIENAEARISAIELSLPTLKLTSKWMLGGVWGIFCLVGLAVARMVVFGA